jgi:mannose-1-phosphate guanylyltransferase/mannose-1-phosphate guanylyltransferase/mannose-6-phosphate isomerase
MADKQIVPVILCGGSGTRLWPRSRTAKPKPFLPLLGNQTLFDEAVLRCSNPELFAAPVIVTGRNCLEHAQTDIALGLGSQFVVEPQSRNTAAAVALAALRLPADAVMLVCPSDHHIQDRSAFWESAATAADLASHGWLVCLGIDARSAETRFGYIRRGDRLSGDAYRIAEFIEKPAGPRAAVFAASNEFCWNAGIFAFRALDYLAELERYRPALVAAARRSVDKGRSELNRFYPESDEFAGIEPESLDHAVMENTDRAAVVPTRIGWSDLGNWFALRDLRPRDEMGNTVRGPVEMVNCRNVMVDTDGPKVSLLGLKDVIVVVDGDDIMIAAADSAHQVTQLKRANSG